MVMLKAAAIRISFHCFSGESSLCLKTSPKQIKTIAALGAIRPLNVQGVISENAILRKGQESPHPIIGIARSPTAL